MNKVSEAVEQLELALRLLDEVGEYYAAAHVSAALETLKPMPFPEDTDWD